MQITLTSKEFDEAVSLWLKAQGFTTDRYSISTRIAVGRSDGGAGTRMIVDLDPMPSSTQSWEEAYDVSKQTPRRFGQGHADE